MKKIAVLGSTGSIGTQALKIIKENKQDLCAHILSAGSNIDLISKQIKEFNPKFVVLPDNEKAHKLAEAYPQIHFFYGDAGLAEAAEKCDYDFMLNSLLGISGFMPTFKCLSSGRDVALANKETLVAGGHIIMSLASEKNLNVIPVDSEHSAIFQCLQNEGNKKSIKKVTLTASGGAFRGMKRRQLADVKKEDALKHPNWTMGNKITIDSATLMNKGFEVIEAKWLFDLNAKQIEVLLHPESIIHSMVEFNDNSTLAQLGQPDMAIPISYAFSYPDRWPTIAEPIDLAKTGSLNFSKPDTDTFKCLKLAIEAMDMGGSYPTALNAANEVLVQYFLEDKIGFLHIGDTIEKILNSHKAVRPKVPEDVLHIDMEVRKQTIAMLTENGGNN